MSNVIKNFFFSIFSREKVNTGRQYEIDFIRGFTLLLLVFTHVILFLYKNFESGLYVFTDIIASEPGAPIFMMVMGISVIFSRKQDAKAFLKRGIILFLGAYALNFARSFPYWFMENGDFFASVPGFFVDDILQLAGLTFLLFALFKALKIPYWGMFLISVGFLIIGQILMSIPNLLNYSEPATYFLNILLPLNNEYCCFNLLTWFIYPCFGLVFGEALIHCKNKDKFYLILLVIGLLGAVALYLNIGLRFPNYTEYYYGGNFYRMGILNTFITILFDLLLISLWYFIGKILPNILQRPLRFLSKNITLFFVLTWFEISAIIHIQAAFNVDFPVIALIGIVIGVIVTCVLLIYPYGMVKKIILQKINVLKSSKEL